MNSSAISSGHLYPIVIKYSLKSSLSIPPSFRPSSTILNDSCSCSSISSYLIFSSTMSKISTSHFIYFRTAALLSGTHHHCPFWSASPCRTPSDLLLKSFAQLRLEIPSLRRRWAVRPRFDRRVRSFCDTCAFFIRGCIFPWCTSWHPPPFEFPKSCGE